MSDQTPVILSGPCDDPAVRDSHVRGIHVALTTWSEARQELRLLQTRLVEHQNAVMVKIENVCVEIRENRSVVRKIEDSIREAEFTVRALKHDVDSLATAWRVHLEEHKAREKERTDTWRDAVRVALGWAVVGLLGLAATGAAIVSGLTVVRALKAAGIWVQ